MADGRAEAREPAGRVGERAPTARRRVKIRKRREAELRTQTQPLRKEIARLEKRWKSSTPRLPPLKKLGDSELYDQSRKAELTDCLQTRAKTKSSLEECEMAWLDAEQLEAMLQAD